MIEEEKRQTRPISPTDLDRAAAIPPDLIEVVNALIRQNFSRTKRSAIVTFREIADAVRLRRSDLSYERLHQELYFDSLANLYAENGWIVTTDRSDAAKRMPWHFIFSAYPAGGLAKG